MTARTISLTATVSAAPDVLASPFDDEVVLLNLGDGVYYGLKGVAARIWSLIQEGARVETIRDSIVAEFDVTPERCTADLQQVLADLSGRGLVVIEDR